MTRAAPIPARRSVCQRGARWGGAGAGTGCSTPRSWPTVRPKSFEREMSLSNSGMVWSPSHLLMAWRDTPIFSPSSSWDRPSPFRSSWIRWPNVIAGTSFKFSGLSIPQGHSFDNQLSGSFCQPSVASPGAQGIGEFVPMNKNPLFRHTKPRGGGFYVQTGGQRAPPQKRAPAPRPAVPGPAGGGFCRLYRFQ